MNQHPVPINLDIRGLYQEVTEQLRATFHSATIAIAGVRRLPEGSPCGLPEDVLTRFIIDSDPETTAAARALAENWIVGCAISDATDVLGHCCENLWRFLALRRCGSGPIAAGTVANWNQPSLREIALGRLGASEAERLDRLGLSEKLNKLESEFQVRCGLRDELRDLQKLRNCLTHRQGRVDSKDLNDSDSRSFRIRYRRVELRVGLGVSQSQGFAPGITLEPGQSVFLKWTHSELTFELNQSITLSPQQFSDLFMTFTLASYDLLDSASMQLASGQHAACQ